MRLQVEIFQQDLLDIIADLSPLHFRMDAGEGESRWLEVQPPFEEDVVLVEGEGFNIRAAASVRYELTKVAVSATVTEVVLLIRPKLVGPQGGSGTLAFEVDLVSAELAGGEDLSCPFTRALRDSFATGRQRLGWELGNAVDARLQVSTGDPGALFLVSIRERSLTVAKDAIRFEVDFGGTAVRESLRAPSAPQGRKHATPKLVA